MTGAGRLSRIEDATSFLILGAMKSGTTSLYRYLEQHPDVCFSEPKEPVFFEAEWEPGPRGLERYRTTYFSHWRGERAVGEARTHNLGLPFVASRVHQTLPRAKLVAILRDPVDRAFSEWWHLFSHGQVRHDFEGGIQENLRRHDQGIRFEGEEGARLWKAGLREPGLPVTGYGLYLDLGYYAAQIERYLAFFPAEQLKVIFFEDLSAEPERVTREVWAFLGVDPQAVLSDTTRRNPARDRVRSPAADRWGAETERFLLDHFAAHNRALEALVGRALPRWFEPDPRRTSARGSAEMVAEEESVRAWDRRPGG